MNRDKVVEIARILQTLSGALESLEKAGAGIPALTQNAIRMKGTLQAIETQFDELLPGEEA
jgi:hypothetical protein